VPGEGEGERPAQRVDAIDALGVVAQGDELGIGEELGVINEGAGDTEALGGAALAPHIVHGALGGVVAEDQLGEGRRFVRGVVLEEPDVQLVGGEAPLGLAVRADLDGQGALQPQALDGADGRVGPGADDAGGVENP